MIVYIDVNVVLDFLLGNREHSLEVAQVLTLLKSSKNQLYTSPNSIIMGFFYLRKEAERQIPENVKHTLALFHKSVRSVPVEGADVDKALGMALPKDLEDGFQIVLASKCKADILITNDKKGFRDAPMKVMSSGEFLKSWEFIKP